MCVCVRLSQVPVWVQMIQFCWCVQVGGIKEKLLAAHRAGIRHVVLPQRNEKDLVELPINVKNQLEISLVSTVEEALTKTFDGGLAPISKL
jgi:ATP-dependent Lon protease